MFVLWRSLRSLVEQWRANGSNTRPSLNPVMSSPVSALGDQPSSVAPPNSHRPLAVSGSIFEPCRFVALLVGLARACGRRPAYCGTQQDADASWPENAGLPRYAVRSVGHHPR
jgi:hypothetical protein